MATIPEINAHIAALNDMFNDFIEYNDSVTFTDQNQQEYITSDTIIKNTEKSTYTAIQSLEEIKKDGLNEFKHLVQSDTTILNLCFILYGQITDANIDKLIVANDLLAFDNTDIDPNNPIILKGQEIIYYK